MNEIKPKETIDKQLYDIVLESRKQERTFNWLGVDIEGVQNPPPPEAMACDALQCRRMMVRMERLVKAFKDDEHMAGKALMVARKLDKISEQLLAMAKKAQEE